MKVLTEMELRAKWKTPDDAGDGRIRSSEIYKMEQ